MNEELRQAIAAMINEANKPITDAVAALTKGTQTIAEGMAALAPEKLDERIAAAVKAAAPKAEPKAEPKVSPEIGAALTPVLDAIKQIGERVESIAQERAAEIESRTVESTVDGWIEKNRPNLKPEAKSTLRRRMLAAAPKDGDACKAAFDGYVEEVKALGFDVKPLTADPKAEGGVEAPSGSEKDDAEKKKEIAERHKLPVLA